MHDHKLHIKPLRVLLLSPKALGVLLPSSSEVQKAIHCIVFPAARKASIQQAKLRPYVPTPAFFVGHIGAHTTTRMYVDVAIWRIFFLPCGPSSTKKVLRTNQIQ